VNRKTADVLFTLFILVLISVAVWDARGWEIKARLFPWVIGIPMITLLAAQLVLTVRQPAGNTSAGFFGVHDIPPSEAKMRAAKITTWLLGFAVALWVFGFAVGGTLATMTYLRFAGREKWPMVVIFGVVTLAFFWVMKNPLTVPFPDGIFFDAIGFKPPV
jgi:hypothetical protein